MKSFVSCYINVRSDPFRLKNIFFKLVLWFWNLIVCWDSKITKKKGGEIIRFGNKCIILMSKSVELISMIIMCRPNCKTYYTFGPFHRFNRFVLSVAGDRFLSTVG